jgi:hypothetical protein
MSCLGCLADTLAFADAGSRVSNSSVSANSKPKSKKVRFINGIVARTKIYLKQRKIGLDAMFL